MKRKDLHKEYIAFIGEDKAGYYIKKFDKLAEGKKFSINFAALFFSTYWCFYRKLFIPGALFLILNFAGIYLTVMMEMTTIGGLLSIIPNIIGGFFGNYLYMNYANKCILNAQDMDKKTKEAYYDDNGGDSARIVLGIVAAFIFFGMALFFSAGSQGL